MSDIKKLVRFVIERRLYGSKRGVICRNLPYMETTPNEIWALKNPSFMKLTESISDVNDNGEIKSFKILQVRGVQQYSYLNHNNLINVSSLKVF